MLADLNYLNKMINLRNRYAFAKVTSPCFDSFRLNNRTNVKRNVNIHKNNYQIFINKSMFIILTQ